MTDAEDSPFAIVDVRASFPEEAASAKTPESEKDVFVRLADEYARVIMNPDCLYQQHWGVTSSNLMAQNVFLKEPSDEQDIQNTQELDTEQSLEDFVMGKLTIHDVFNHFGINDLQTLGVTEVYEDVLSLFAQDLKQKRIERIPARTRDEHHHISLDSHYQPEETSASFIKSKSED